MTAIEKLEEYFQNEKRHHGLLDMKFFPGTSRDAVSEDVAAEIVKIVNLSDDECVDTTPELR